jgi:lipid II:glycine glycyltransferase (peptidoglycan interpeptide bridge formation enzyme)
MEDPLGTAVTGELRAAGWQFSPEQIQFRNTIQMDLTHSQEELLGGMKQKTRYNIRLAERRGVSVRPGSLQDLDLLYQMYAETSLRDGFVIRDPAYYQGVWSILMLAGLAEPLIAEVEGQAVGAVMIFHFAQKAWYFYGMSRDSHREKMYTYLLQWEAMRRAQDAGYRLYDFWGAPDDFNPDDSMWGVYRFKEGFGGQVVRTLGAWDLPVRPLLYRMYTRVLPRLLALMRRQGRERTQQTLLRS